MENLQSYRDQFAKAKTLPDKIRHANTLLEQYNALDHGLASNAIRNYVDKTVRPILDCLRLHFKNDVDEFGKQYGPVVMTSVTKFVKKACIGRGPRCQPK